MKFGRLRSQSDAPKSSIASIASFASPTGKYPVAGVSSEFPKSSQGKPSGRKSIYTHSDAMFERSMSTPDLGIDSSIDLAALDREAACLLACMCLDVAERSGDHFVKASPKDKPLPRTTTPSTLLPPDYNLLAPLSPRYPILPREEEGSEKLPSYAPSVVREGILFRKPEMLSPFAAAPQRSWSLVHVELNNTQLNIYTANRKLRKNSSPDDVRDYQVGSLQRSYTLQYAEVGAAVDYSKRPYVIRVRAESEQFLLECASQEEYIIWINMLQMAIDLALPLEERRLPKYRSIPRRRRRTEGSSSAAVNEVLPENSAIGRKLQSMTNIKRFLNPSRMTTPTNESTPNEFTTRPRSNTTPVMGRLVNTFRRPQRSRHMSFTNNESTPLESMSPIMRIDSSLSIAASTIASSCRSDSVAESSASSSSTTSASSIAESSVHLSSEAANETTVSPPALVEEDDDDDDDDYENDASRLGMDESFLESAEPIGEKWNPRYNAPSYASYLRYAQRCLTSLYSHSSWTNKTIIREGKKYVVRQDCFEKVSSTVKC